MHTYALLCYYSPIRQKSNLKFGGFRIYPYFCTRNESMMVLRILCLLLALAATVSVRSADVERDLARLDSCIQMKAQFDKQKEDRLQVLKDNLKSATDGNARYSVLYRMFTEYESYNFDSAYHYARQAADLSVTLKNRDFQVEAGCAIVFCYLSAGLYKEAFDVMGMIDHDGVGEEYQQQYYMMWSRLYYDLANYNNSQPYEEEYVRKGNLYVDTLLQYVPEKSVYWYYALAQRQMKSHDFAGSTDTFKKMLALKGATVSTIRPKPIFKLLPIHALAGTCGLKVRKTRLSAIWQSLPSGTPAHPPRKIPQPAVWQISSTSGGISSGPSVMRRVRWRMQTFMGPVTGRSRLGRFCLL